MYGVFRVDKINNTHKMYGIEKHVERRNNTSNTNPQINRAQSSKNYDLHDKFDETFVRQVKKRLKEAGITKTRKDAVLLSELLFSASHEFFENMSSQEIRQYFQKCYDWVCKKYGKENVVSAMVHLDEHTPHMHIMLVPITKEGKLAHNTLFDGKKVMRELQTETHEKIFSEYGLERGQPKEETQKKHLTTYQWKKEQAEKMKDLSFDIKEMIMKKYQLQDEIDQLEKQKDNSEIIQTRKHLQEVTSRLNEMMKTLESDPELLKYYKIINREIKQAQNRNTDEREL